MRVRPRVGSSSPRPLASGFSASRTSRMARPRLATLRRWRRTARRSPTRGLPGRWCASTRIQSTPHHHSSTRALPSFDAPFLADACQVAYGGHPHLVRPLQGPGWRLDPVRHPGRHRRHHLPHVGDKRCFAARSSARVTNSGKSVPVLIPLRTPARRAGPRRSFRALRRSPTSSSYDGP